MTKFAITADAARDVPRFAFIAAYLVHVTRKAENLMPLKTRVRYAAGTWSVVQGSGKVVVYTTKDADKLFDYVRRGQLGYWVRRAEDFRILAFEEKGMS